MVVFVKHVSSIWNDKLRELAVQNYFYLRNLKHLKLLLNLIFEPVVKGNVVHRLVEVRNSATKI